MRHILAKVTLFISILLLSGCKSTIEFNTPQEDPLTILVHPAGGLSAHLIELEDKKKIEIWRRRKISRQISAVEEEGSPVLWSARCISFTRKLYIQKKPISVSILEQVDMDYDKSITEKDVLIMSGMLHGKIPKRKWNLIADKPLLRDSIYFNIFWNPKDDKDIMVKAVKVCGSFINP